MEKAEAKSEDRDERGGREKSTNNMPYQSK